MSKSTKEYRPSVADKTSRERPEPIEWQALVGYPQGEVRGKVRACGDIVTPVVSSDAWDAEKGPDLGT